MALTEIIDTIPIFMRRIYLKKGLVIIVWSLAIGHTMGSLLHGFLWGQEQVMKKTENQKQIEKEYSEEEKVSIVIEEY